MKKRSVLIPLLVLPAIFFFSKERVDPKVQVAAALNAYHHAAAQADAATYFGLMTADGVFLGTDAKERWDRDAFAAYAKPYFDQGKGWTFRPRDRHIYLSGDGKTAWFDEMLDSDHLGTCRGSGVLVHDGEWKIAQYHLTYPVPNELILEVIAKAEGKNQAPEKAPEK